MPTFKELVRAAQITVEDKTSGKRVREIRQILRNHHAFSGLTPQKATAILEDLGPTFVKMGQIASNRSDIIPKEYADAFASLRTKVKAVPFQAVIDTIQTALGHSWQESFSEIDQEPLGSASVAQVHRARLQGDGQLVALKVRRPYVVEQMAEDITLVRHVLALADLTHVVDGMMLSFEELVNELERTTSDELDFCVELTNLQRFRDNLVGDQGISSPGVYPAFGSDELLVMEYVDGVHINDTEALRAQGDNPAALGRRLAENYVTQVIDRGFFHADPHAGNILVRDHIIEWIDLGMVGSLSALQRALVGRLFSAVAENDPYKLKEALLALSKPHGAIDHGLLLQQIGTLLASYSSADLADINIGTAMLDVIEVMRTQKLMLPPSITMLARGMLTIEGVLVDITPDTSVVEIISRHVRKQVFSLPNFEAKTKEFLSASAASAQAMAHLPSQLSHSLDMIDRGQIKVKTDLGVPEELIAVLYSVVGTLSLALISAGLFVGSSLVAQTGMEPRVLGVPLLGILGYGGALVLSIYVVWRTFLTRHQQRNDKKIE